ncbi:MAG: DUF192 domain-containing protein, partial [Dehalococcoidia bacterium]|nr:DUF192 domain-containing protein [Dehalococcoidia bacterium]
MPGQAIITINHRQWTVSMATTLQELVQGLGGMATIPPGTGMLFDMGQEQTITVTTVPMLFPLDIVFLNNYLMVNDLALNAAPGYLVTTEVPARFFLEVNAGEFVAVQKGQQASLNVVSSGAPSAAGGLSQAISLIASLFTLSLMVSMVRSFVRGVLPVPRRAAGPGLMMAKTNPKLIEPEVGVSKTLGSSELPQVIVNEDFLDNLQSLLDEDKKTDSLRKLESTLSRLTPEQRRSIDGLDDLEQAIKEYKDIQR